LTGRDGWIMMRGLMGAAMKDHERMLGEEMERRVQE
jgi:hypothetical protein